MDRNRKTEKISHNSYEKHLTKVFNHPRMVVIKAVFITYMYLGNR